MNKRFFEFNTTGGHHRQIRDLGANRTFAIVSISTKHDPYVDNEPHEPVIFGGVSIILGKSITNIPQKAVIGGLRKNKTARHVISERNISDEWIDQVISDPDLVTKDHEDPELEHHLGTIEEFGNRVLRVVLNTTVEPSRIVTAYFDRSMKGEL